MIIIISIVFSYNIVMLEQLFISCAALCGTGRDGEVSIVLYMVLGLHLHRMVNWLVFSQVS